MHKLDEILKHSGANDVILHKGVKGMKWGFNDGERNGNRTADEDEEELLYPADQILPEDQEEAKKELRKILLKQKLSPKQIEKALKDGVDKALIKIFGKAKNKETISTDVTINGKTTTVTRIIKDVKEKNKEKANGKISINTPSKSSPTKGSKEWYDARLKKETPSQTRKRLKNEWKNVPNAKITELSDSTFFGKPVSRGDR